MKPKTISAGQTRREAAYASVAKVLRRAIDDADITEEELGRYSGRPQSLISKWISTSWAHSPKLADVVCWPRSLRRYVLGRLFGDDADEVEDDLEQLTRLIDEASALQVHYARAISDGTIDADEAQLMSDQGRRLLAEVHVIVAHSDAVLEQRGARVRRSRPEVGEA